MPKSYVSRNEFIKIYQESSSYSEVTQRTGIGERGIYGRVIRYRKQGVELKKYKGGTRSKFTDEQFAKIWNNSSTLEEVSKKSGIKLQGIHARHRTLVKKGFKLKIISKSKSYNVSNIELIQNGFGYWFCGLVDGEGHIGVEYRRRDTIVNGKPYKTSELNIHLTVTLRDDDLSALQHVFDSLECGYLNSRRRITAPSTHNPVSDWRVANTFDLVNRIIPIISKCKLRTKKWEQFILWREAVQIKNEAMKRHKNGKGSQKGTRLTDNEIDRILQIVQELKEIRRYKNVTL